jgi:AcrR family transcriptional regulator
MTALTSDGKITTNTRWGTSKNADAREARDRILDAASRCFDRAGVPKTTMRDVAAEAKVTRTTLYRYFENREAVVVGVMLRETHHFRERILEALKDIDDVGEFIVEGILFCLREAPKRQLHILLFGGEASNLMGRLFLSSEQLFEIGIELLRPLFEPAREKGLLRDGIELSSLHEWVARIILSYMTTPSSRIENEAEMRELLRRLLLPAVMKEPTA